MNYYDDSKRLIATNETELLMYFNSLNGATAADVPITLPCAPTAIIQVQSSGVVPKFIYRGTPVPKNKIYPQILPANTIDLNVLCNGSNPITNITPPDCGAVMFYAFVLPAPDCGTVIFVSGYDQLITITPYSSGGWQLFGDYSSTVSPDGVVTLNISLINPPITSHTLLAGKVCEISINGRPNTFISMSSASHPNLLDPSTLNILANGDITYNGYETSFSPMGAVLQIFNVQFNKNN